MRIRNALYVVACFGLMAGAASAQDRAARFNERDANGDGVLTPHEYQATGGHPGNFRSLDSDGNGQLTRAEFLGRGEGSEGADQQAVEDARAYKQGGRVHEDDVYRNEDVYRKNESVKGGVYGNSDVLSKSGAGRVNTAFRNKDRNRDGVLSRREYGQASTFNRVDQDDDGVISAWEYANPPAAPSAASRRARRVRD